MRWRLSLAPVLLVVLILPGCKSTKSARPPVQSPQRVASNEPPADPAAPSSVTSGPWCQLRYQEQDWSLCNIHYHRPAEHGRRFDTTPRVLPPCAASAPDDWVEIHYAYVRGPSHQVCELLRERSLLTDLGRDCPAPYIVRAVWAQVSTGGTFRPTMDDLPGSPRYFEYLGSSTGGTNGAFPAYWKINRDCLRLTASALTGVHLDPTRELQNPPPPAGRPRSTMDQP